MIPAEWVIVVQCARVQERCGGYFCERAYQERADGFADLPADRRYRYMTLSCGGCPGDAVHRKLHTILKHARRREGVRNEAIHVYLSSCITKSNYHAPRCPHTERIHEVIQREGLTAHEDTRISPTSEARRAEGRYR